ncbi:UbiX family flavin prenyltransferase [Pseudohongiella spirulinae]|uniref:Flavin prenyltransferase UbiX n=1 Tax=Pseudohongiella spirulinae TaxID=1249552 RepID=A0A0S2KA69_9GAMM|nr:UbiX family flavin prenyltransferase [Pseudohongiella spirulinae]ALO45223.1 Putative aromatic acid decarboxylase [Pseudohongiella spirulinae]
MGQKRRLIIGMSGASGLIYGIRMLQILQHDPDIATHLVMTPSARLNISLETAWQTDQVLALADEVHSVKDLAASIASGSFKTDGMIVAPCSMKTLSAIVHSYADNLLTRAADVVLKERRRLVLMPRETPLHAGHCELLLKACQLGAIVAPPMPALYTLPKTVDDIINHSVGRVLDLFDIESGLVSRWQGAAHQPRL